MKVVLTRAEQLHESGRRLDGSYHASDGVRALHSIRQWAGLPEHASRPAANALRDQRQATYGTRRLDRLEEVCVEDGVYIPSRFKRIFVDDPEHGAPYLTGGLIMQANPLERAKLLSYRFTSNMDELALRERMSLVTCSGTIGNTAYVNASFAGAVGSPDLLRIVADPAKIPPGYLYAYLSSQLGIALIEQKTYGAVVPHIEAHHVVDLPVPRLEPDTEQRIHASIERAAALRVEANEALNQASTQLAEAIGSVPSVPKKSHLGFVAHSKDLGRLTAFSHKPSLKAVRRVIVERGQYARLCDVTLRIFHPFRMNMVYVAEGRGVPFLNLADMMSNRYRTSNFMSPRTLGFENYLLEYGWTLISRSGTIGKVCFAGHYLEGTATNEHISRIVPDTNCILPGYLYVFMTSPYAQLQIESLIYGTIILTIYEQELGEILVPLLDRVTMQAIHDGVERAFESRYEATRLEDQAQSLLLDTLNLEMA